MNLEERISLIGKLALYLGAGDNKELETVKQKAWEKNKWFTKTRSKIF